VRTFVEKISDCHSFAILSCPFGTIKGICRLGTSWGSKIEKKIKMEMEIEIEIETVQAAMAFEETQETPLLRCK
jgi:hypothetical protein